MPLQMLIRGRKSWYNYISIYLILYSAINNRVRGIYHSWGTLNASHNKKNSLFCTLNKILFHELESGLARLSFLNYIRPCFWLEWARFLQAFKHGRMIAFLDFYFFWRIVSKLGKIESCWRGLARIRGIRIPRSAFTFLLRSTDASFRAGCDIFVIVALLFSFMDVVVSGTKLMVYEGEKVLRWKISNMVVHWTRIFDNNIDRIISGETNFINLIKHFFFCFRWVSSTWNSSLIKIKRRRVSSDFKYRTLIIRNY